MKKNQIVVLENGNGLVTKAFAKQARIFGTPEYKLWKQFVAENEGAEMEIRTVNKNTQSDKYCKNLTYKNMEEHIKTFAKNDEENKLMEEFKTIVIRSKVQVNPYKYVVDWFKATFPNYKEIQKSFDNENVENSNKNIKISA